jgi:hypothetical protein
MKGTEEVSEQRKKGEAATHLIAHSSIRFEVPFSHQHKQRVEEGESKGGQLSPAVVLAQSLCCSVERVEGVTVTSNSNTRPRPIFPTVSFALPLPPILLISLDLSRLNNTSSKHGHCLLRLWR